ncbi:MAG: 50S ribosomal protein L35 [Thermotogae bacterium]|nr:50S ribosomal protein L35 [Thermotogota bacterium]MCP5465957.1 50S ribosomal protein L35 [Thermotogota bacterium]HOO75622.1 50S ribosomal protein L35 [Tepiditoga sp.]
MPKMKTKSALKKRFKISGSGKIMRKRSHTAHNTGFKTNSRMRRLKGYSEIPATLKKQEMRALGLR